MNADVFYKNFKFKKTLQVLVRALVRAYFSEMNQYFCRFPDRKKEFLHYKIHCLVRLYSN
jgi:hypothetical protein